MNTLCVYDDNNFSFYGRESGGDNKFYHYNNSNLEEVINDDIDFNSIGYRLIHKGSCLYKSTSNDPSNGIYNGYFKSNASGEIEIISNPDINRNELTWEKAFTFNDKLYFFEPSVVNFYFLYELGENSTEPEIVVEIDKCTSCYNVEITVTSDYLFFDTNIFTNVISNNNFRTTFVLDKQLNDITSYIGSEVSPQFASQDNEPVLLYQEDISKVVITDSGLIAATLKSPFTNFTNVIGDGGQVFLFGNNRENKNKLALYKVSNQLAISNQLDGLWINDDYKSQGLSIHTGVRSDNSQYIFVSFYIYRDGLPFWIAGSVDYSNGLSEISVDLFEYEGSSFVTSNNDLDDLTISFGSMTIRPTGCNNIVVDISLNNEQPLILPMDRLTNNTKEDMCID